MSPRVASEALAQTAPRRAVHPKRSRRVRILVAAGVAAGIAALLLLASQLTREPPVSAQRSEVTQRAARIENGAVRRKLETAALGSGVAVGLAEMSDRFRNATLAAAIHDAGFVCDDVVQALRSAADVWVASCRNMINYRVDVTAGSELVVRPVASYFDDVLPPAIHDERFRVDRDAPIRMPRMPRQE